MKPCKTILLLLALCVAFNARAATNTVTSTADNGPNTLRAALAAAANGDTINFSLPLPATILLTTSELQVTKNVTILGPGATNLVIDGNNARRVFGVMSGTVNISDLSILHGAGDFSGGGGIRNLGSMTITRCAITANSCSGSGGGIYNVGTLTVHNCTLALNLGFGFGGGALYNGVAATALIDSSTFYGNQSTHPAGGGGAILNDFISPNSGTVALTNCTIAGNSATYGGGGIYGAGITKCASTIVAGNTASLGPDYFGNVIPSYGYNLIGKTDGSFGWVASDLTGTIAMPRDPMLGALQDNGGPTLTMALLAGSPAIDAGHSRGISTDQRGAPRPCDKPAIVNASGGDGSDIGAYELQSRLTTTTVGAGVVLKNPDQVLYNCNSTVLVAPVPAQGWVFDHWSGDASGANNPLTVVMNGDKSITAHFTAATACAQPPSGLVTWWPGSGDANDLLGNNHGTPLNGVAFVPGQVGAAFSFDGVNDSVAIGGTPIPTPWTAEFWVNRQNSPFSAATLIGDSATALRLEQFNFSRRVGFTQFGVADYIFNYTAPVGVWTHLVFVGRATDTQLYVNGALQDTIAATIPLGRNVMGGPIISDQLKGLLDEVSLWNRALAAAEILAIYNAGSTGKCQPACAPMPSGLVSWWPAGGNANDAAGNNNGALQNGASFTPGRTGQAFSFDGVDDHVLVPDSGALNPSAGLTIEAWIKTSDTPLYSGVVNKFHEIAAGGNNTGYALGFNTGGTMRCDLGNGAGSYSVAVNPTVVTGGQWHHVAAVFSPSQMLLYVDGVAGPPTTPTGFAASNDRPLYLGRDPASNDRFFNGLIDEASIYNRALSAGEIFAIYDAGSAGKCLAPVYITNISKSGNSLSLTWLSQRGLTYRVQSKSDLNSAMWFDVMPDVTATGATTSFTGGLPPNQPQLFLRVVMFR